MFTYADRDGALFRWQRDGRVEVWDPAVRRWIAYKGAPDVVWYQADRLTPEAVRQRAPSAA